eukprot:642725-Rhodomonas_salina.5
MEGFGSPHALTPGTLRHKEKGSKVFRAPTQDMSEEGVAKLVMRYIEHHACARLLIAAEQRPHTWVGAPKQEEAPENGDRAKHDQRSYSVAAARLLGAEGMGLLVQSGADVDDEAVVAVAKEALLEECKVAA